MKADELKYPGSRRIYVPGALFPEIKVAMREVTLSDSVFPDGTTEPNEPVRIYDCSDPWGGMRLFMVRQSRDSPA